MSYFDSRKTLMLQRVFNVDKYYTILMFSYWRQRLKNVILIIISITDVSRY